MTYHHGIKVNEPVTGARPIKGVATAVIGLVATAIGVGAPEIAALDAAFPLNKPVLVTDVRTSIGVAGTNGTLKKALTAIADQTSPIIIVVRVAPGANVAATNTNVIGTTIDGVYTGLQALLAAETETGIRPRIIGCPGLDTPEVTAAMAIIAKRLRGFAYAGVTAANVADVLTYRANYAARELMLIWPEFSGGFVGDAVARALGLRARIDEEIGWHKTLSNVAVDGVTGLSKNVFFDLTDSTNDAGLLNAGDVTTLVRMNGFRFWGSRTCSDEPKFAFESAVRTAQALQDSIAYGIAWAVDKPITAGLVRDILETINSEFRSLVAQGRVIGATAWFDPALNSATDLAGGKLTIDYDYTPCAPAEQITLNQRITDRYYATLGASL
jgi:uncharacterized protein